MHLLPAIKSQQSAVEVRPPVSKYPPAAHHIWIEALTDLLAWYTCPIFCSTLFGSIKKPNGRNFTWYEARLRLAGQECSFPSEKADLFRGCKKGTHLALWYLRLSKSKVANPNPSSAGGQTFSVPSPPEAPICVTFWETRELWSYWFIASPITSSCKRSSLDWHKFCCHTHLSHKPALHWEDSQFLTKNIWAHKRRHHGPTREIFEVLNGLTCSTMPPLLSVMKDPP